jgi:hypothetical protein
MDVCNLWLARVALGLFRKSSVAVQRRYLTVSAAHIPIL